MLTCDLIPVITLIERERGDQFCTGFVKMVLTFHTVAITTVGYGWTVLVRGVL